MDNTDEVKIKELYKPKVIYNKEINSFLRLGKEIKISPKSNCTLNEEGFKAHYNVESVSLTINIGDKHIAILSMTKEAWLSLQSGEEISFMTTEQFKKQLYGRVGN